MKRLCSIATVALIAVGVNAQQNGKSTSPIGDRLQRNESVQRPVQHPAAQQGTQRDVLFSEDFANGLAGNNGVGAWTVSGTNGNVWRISTKGPVGAYSDPVDEKIGSTTAANGFAIFNSDSVNTNFAVTPPVAVTPRVNLSGSLVSPVLDLTGSGAVEIRYTEMYRSNGGTSSDHLLEISTNGGTSWATSISIDQGAASNAEYATHTNSVNISSALGADRSNVRFRFTQGGTHSAYYWELDDIAISSVPPNELIMMYGATSQFGGGYEYGRVPQSQIQNTVNVQAGIVNYGSNTQEEVTVYVSLKDDATGTEVGSSTIILGTIVSGDTVTAEADMTVPSPLPVGHYTAYFTMSSDSIAEDANMSNNFKNRYFEITNDLYSIDSYSVIPDSLLTLTSLGTTSFTDNTQDVRLMNLYIITTPTVFYGVQIRMSAQSQPGSYFIAAVYDTADVYVVDQTPTALVESDPRIITQADYDSRLASVSFLQPITLAPGAYYVSANLYQEGGNNLVILDDTSVPQPGDASMIYLPIADANNRHTWGNGNAFCVRLSSEFHVGVQETPGLDGITMYPSPTSGLLHVQAKTAGNMTVEVFNALGSKVQNSTFNGTETTLDLSSQAAGIYMVRVGDGTNFNMQRVVVK